MKRREIHIVLHVLLAFFASFHTSHAQQSNTFYLMQEVPQNTLVNPAVQIPCRIYVGIPVFTGLHLNYGNTSFTYEDVASGSTWNLDALQAQSHRSDLYALEGHFTLLGLGYMHLHGYFTFHIRERGLFYQTIPGDLVDFAVAGNGPYAGETLKANGFRPISIHAREYSAGLSRNFGPYIKAGVRAKLLFGKANINAGRSQATISTAQDNFELELESDYTLNTSYPYTILYDEQGNPDGIEFEEIILTDYAMNRSNPGFAIDLGLVYEYDDRTTLSASLLDLGFIRWRSDINNIHVTGSYNYSGVDMNADVGSSAYIWEVLDTIAHHMDLSTANDAYTSMLPAQLYLAGEYQVHDKISVGLVNRNLLFRSKWHTSFSLLGKITPSKHFSSTLSWSYLNNSILNFGMGLAYTGRGIQVHAVTDNLLAAFYPFDTRTINLRLGVNLLLGCPRNRRERLEFDTGRSLPGVDCPAKEDPKKKQRRMNKAARRINR